MSPGFLEMASPGLRGRGGAIFSSAAGPTTINNIIISNVAYITTGVGYGGCCRTVRLPWH